MRINFTGTFALFQRGPSSPIDETARSDRHRRE
jgi:hypothetical protein